MTEVDLPRKAYNELRSALSRFDLADPLFFFPPDPLTYSFKEIEGRRFLEQDSNSTLLRLDCLSADEKSRPTRAELEYSQRTADKVKQQLFALAEIKSEVFETSVLVDLKQPEFEAKLATLVTRTNEKTAADAINRLGERVASAVKSVKDSIPEDPSGRRVYAPGVAAKTIVEAIRTLQGLAQELEVANMVEAGLSPRNGLERATGTGK